MSNFIYIYEFRGHKLFLHMGHNFIVMLLQLSTCIKTKESYYCVVCDTEKCRTIELFFF